MADERIERIAAFRQNLGRRERQILDIIYSLEWGTVSDVQQRLPDPPSYATVRKWLFLMEQKGLVEHRRSGKRYEFRASVPHKKARRAAVHHLVATFFRGSHARAVSAMLEESGLDMDPDDRDLIQRLIDRAEKKGR